MNQNVYKAVVKETYTKYVDIYAESTEEAEAKLDAMVENDHNFLPSASTTDSKYELTTEIM